MAEERVFKALSSIAQQLARDGLNVSKLILFGSHAEGTAHDDSDVDVAIVSDDFRGKDIFERAEMNKSAEILATRQFKLPFDIIALTVDEFEKETSLAAA